AAGCRGLLRPIEEGGDKTTSIFGLSGDPSTQNPSSPGSNKCGLSCDDMNAMITAKLDVIQALLTGTPYPQETLSLIRDAKVASVKSSLVGTQVGSQVGTQLGAQTPASTSVGTAIPLDRLSSGVKIASNLNASTYAVLPLLLDMEMMLPKFCACNPSDAVKARIVKVLSQIGSSGLGSPARMLTTAQELSSLTNTTRASQQASSSTTIGAGAASDDPYGLAASQVGVGGTTARICDNPDTVGAIFMNKYTQALPYFPQDAIGRFAGKMSLLMCGKEITDVCNVPAVAATKVPTMCSANPSIVPDIDAIYTDMTTGTTSPVDLVVKIYEYSLAKGLCNCESLPFTPQAMQTFIENKLLGGDTAAITKLNTICAMKDPAQMARDLLYDFGDAHYFDAMSDTFVVQTFCDKQPCGLQQTLINIIR
ncbi:MAG: hypothetical protein WCQ53_07385, partial [bacterium]